MGMDDGPETLNLFNKEIGQCNTIVFNRSIGFFERMFFATSTTIVEELMADAANWGATTTMGGGDSGVATNRAGLGSRVSHIGTGGALWSC